jgi:hypothetical protein
MTHVDHDDRTTTELALEMGEDHLDPAQDQTKLEDHHETRDKDGGTQRGGITPMQFERWLISRIDWMEKRLKEAIQQENTIFRVVYQSGLDVLLEVLRQYRTRGNGVLEVTRPDRCAECEERKLLVKLRELLSRLDLIKSGTRRKNKD